MLSPARFPLGTPGVFTLPDVAAPLLHPERMDVCAFVGVAPRGAARVPVVDESHPADWTMVAGDRPVRRSVPVLVRSFDEYVHQFGAFEGPGLLPHAVTSYFEQGGRLAWIVRVVHDRPTRPFHQHCAKGWLRGAFTQDIRFIARSPGLWGRGLRLTLSFSTTALAFSLGAGGRIEVDPRAGLQVGTTLRLTDADGHAMLAVCEGLTRVRNLTQARERLALDLSLPPPYPPAFVEVVEAVLDIERAGGPDTFLRNVVANPPVVAARMRKSGSGTLGRLGTPTRLALEMALHEEQERRALEGELKALELAWKAAEEVAAIAVDLLLPEKTKTFIERQRDRSDAD